MKIVVVRRFVVVRGIRVPFSCPMVLGWFRRFRALQHFLGFGLDVGSLGHYAYTFRGLGFVFCQTAATP